MQNLFLPLREHRTRQKHIPEFLFLLLLQQACESELTCAKVRSENSEYRMKEWCYILNSVFFYSLCLQPRDQMSYHIIFHLLGGIFFLTTVPEFKTANSRKNGKNSHVR